MAPVVSGSVECSVLEADHSSGGLERPAQPSGDEGDQSSTVPPLVSQVADMAIGAAAQSGHSPLSQTDAQEANDSSNAQQLILRMLG
jgi:hypothetical protein